jgi:hypothetical protein
MRERVTALEVLAAFGRVGVVSAADHQAASLEWRPDERVRYLSPAWYVGVLAQLPDGAGPAQVRTHLRAALDALDATGTDTPPVG